MKRTVFEIPGDPLPWARAGQNGRLKFTQERQKAYQRTVREAAIAARIRPIAGPVLMEITCIFRAPASLSTARRAALIGRWRDKGEDVDNLAKIIMDALQAGRRKRVGRQLVETATPLAYQNDSQVASLTVHSLYGWHPRTVVEVRPAFEADLPDIAEAERSMARAAE